MPTYEKIKLAIYVDDVELPEFGVEEDVKGKAVSCWVPSQLGKDFELLIDNGFQKLATDVYVDGVKVYAATVKKNGCRNLAYYPESDKTWRSLKFTKADLVDDDDILQKSQECQGEIRVACYRFGELRKRNKGICWGFPESNKVHERVKKGITDCVGVGDATFEGLPLPRNRTVRLEDEIATFVFQYRSLEVLQANGIVPVKQQSPETLLDIAWTPERKLGIKEENPEGEIKKEASQPNSMPELEVKAEENEVVGKIEAKIDVFLGKVEELMEELRGLKRKRSSACCLQKYKKVKVEPRPLNPPVEIIDLTTEYF